MNVKELRIGNLVTDEFYADFNKVIVVESMNLYGINLSSTDDGRPYGMHSARIERDYDAEDLQGIPLTEEWLIRFGFEDTSYARFYKNFNGTEVLTVDFKDYAHTSLREFPIEVSDFSLEIDCKYVHQLQNLWFSITGQELTLSPPQR